MGPNIHIYRLYPRVKSTHSSPVHTPMHLHARIRRVGEPKTAARSPTRVCDVVWTLGEPPPTHAAKPLSAHLGKWTSKMRILLLTPIKHSSSQFSCELYLRLEAPAPVFPWWWGERALAFEEDTTRSEDLLLLTLNLDVSPNLFKTSCPLFKKELLMTYTTGQLSWGKDGQGLGKLAKHTACPWIRIEGDWCQPTVRQVREIVTGTQQRQLCGKGCDPRAVNFSRVISSAYSWWPGGREPGKYLHLTPSLWLLLVPPIDWIPLEAGGREDPCRLHEVASHTQSWMEIGGGWTWRSPWETSNSSAKRREWCTEVLHHGTWHVTCA